MTMTVSDLRTALRDLPDDMLVVLSSDAEGNEQSPLSDVDQRMYVAENAWSGDVYPTPEEIASPGNDLTDEDGPPEGAVRCAVLWPVN